MNDFFGNNEVLNKMKVGDRVPTETIESFIWGEIDNQKTTIYSELETRFVGDTKMALCFERDQECDPFIYKGLCSLENSKERHPATMRKVFIISPFAPTEDCIGETDEERLRNNIAIANGIARRIFMNGDWPVAPHLYFPSFLNDGDPFERAWSIEAGHQMMRECDAFVLATIGGVISKGMQADLDYAIGKLALEHDKTFLLSKTEDVDAAFNKEK